MLTPEQIQQVRQLFDEGKTPDEISELLGMPRTSLIYRLGQSGYRIENEMRRRLVPIVPVALPVAPTP